MPMDRSALLWARNIVVNSDIYPVSPIGLNGRTGELPVDKDTAFLCCLLGNVVS